SADQLRALPREARIGPPRRVPRRPAFLGECLAGPLAVSRRVAGAIGRGGTRARPYPEEPADRAPQLALTPGGGIRTLPVASSISRMVDGPVFPPRQRRRSRRIRRAASVEATGITKIRKAANEGVRWAVNGRNRRPRPPPISAAN